MKKLISLIALISLLLTCSLSLSSCAKKLPGGVVESAEATDYVLIDVENYGQMIVRLYPDTAPKTVENFKKLVGDGFYNGLTFHRVDPDFVIQGGDPKGNGSGGSQDTIYGEFSENGFENTLKHERGVLSMARSNDPDSASSQFFIVTQTSTNATYSLDGKYAAFGRVIYGIEVVDEIAKVQTNYAERPLTSVVMKSVFFVDVTGTEFEGK